jgi:hypothetical protein
MVYFLIETSVLPHHCPITIWPVSISLSIGLAGLWDKTLLSSNLKRIRSSPLAPIHGMCSRQIPLSGGLTNLQRRHSVPRTQRSAQRCAAEPGSIVLLSLWVPALRSSAKGRCTASGTRAECGLSAFPSSDTSDKPPAGATAFPGRSAARSGALLSRGPPCCCHYGSRLCAAT